MLLYLSLQDEERESCEEKREVKQLARATATKE